MNRRRFDPGWLPCGLFAVAAILTAAAGRSWNAALLAVAAGIWCGRLLGEHRRSPPPNAAKSDLSEPWQSHALRATLTALDEGVVVLDRDDRMLASNAAARDLLGIGDSAEPRAIEEVVDWPQLLAALAKTRREHGAVAFTAERGEGTSARTVAVVIAITGRDDMATIVLRDESRLRQLESLRRDFVANVSHELKTPLAAIQGFVETLLDDPDVPPPTRLRFLQRVQVQVGRLATLVSDLLTLSRLDEHGGEPADPCAFDQVVREVLRDLQPFADKRTVMLRAELGADPVLVAAEREALRQVVSNLVDNAIKYTPAGGSVTVQMLPQGLRTELRVVDTGIGLSESDQQRVFERFYRVDKARSRELGGTGLGLSIVKNTVQAIGGEVGVESALGRGSTFWVRLPVVVAHA